MGQSSAINKKPNKKKSEQWLSKEEGNMLWKRDSLWVNSSCRNMLTLGDWFSVYPEGNCGRLLPCTLPKGTKPVGHQTAQISGFCCFLRPGNQSCWLLIKVCLRLSMLQGRSSCPRSLLFNNQLNLQNPLSESDCVCLSQNECYLPYLTTRASSIIMHRWNWIESEEIVGMVWGSDRLFL